MKTIIRKIVPNRIYKILSKAKFLILKLIFNFQTTLWKKNKIVEGTSKWLIIKEIEYGGYAEISVNKINNKKQKNRKIHRGGDRMNKLYHNYSKIYSKYLKPFLKEKNITLVEVGILRGTGVAIWSDLFPNGHIIGLDVDLSYIKDNMNNLVKKNAFTNNNLELYEFDQFQNNYNLLKKILKSRKINICIDDGDHSDEAIIRTIESIKPFLSEKFVYFIEDNKNIFKRIKEKYPQFKVYNYGELSVIISF